MARVRVDDKPRTRCVSMDMLRGGNKSQPRGDNSIDKYRGGEVPIKQKRPESSAFFRSFSGFQVFSNSPVKSLHEQAVQPPSPTRQPQSLLNNFSLFPSASTNSSRSLSDTPNNSPKPKSPTKEGATVKESSAFVV